MRHNFEAQRRDTFASFKGVKNLPATAVVEFVFFLEETDADWAGFEKALKARGFRTKREDEITLIAIHGPMPITPEAIWEKERLSTEIALAHDFYPDGWDLAE